jgi:hypothetical protein
MMLNQKETIMNFISRSVERSGKKGTKKRALGRGRKRTFKNH